MAKRSLDSRIRASIPQQRAIGLEAAAQIESVRESNKKSLSCLPLELREIIYDYLFHADPRAKPAHFHIYDKVFDGCTYEDVPSKWPKPGNDIHLRRQRGLKTAILRTSHAVYQEAVQFLYDNTIFELILLPGLLRPDLGRGGYRNCLGKPGACKQLHRMRHVKIVAQPGKCPDVPRYITRIKRFLEDIEYGTRLWSLALDFRFHCLMDVTLGVEVVRAFQCLQGKDIALVSPSRTMRRGWTPLELAQAAAFEFTANLAKSCNQARTRKHTLTMPKTAHPYSNLCARRALRGQELTRASLSWKEEVAFWSVGVVLLGPLLPVTFAAIVVDYVRTKNRKGESWRKFP